MFDTKTDSQILLFLKIFSSCKVSRSKKGILVLITYAICSIILISFLKSNIYPKSEVCHSHNITKLNSESILDCKIEAYLRHNFSKYSNISSVKSSGWVQMIQNIFIYSAYIDKCPSSMSGSFCVIFIGMCLNNNTEINVVSSSINCALKSKSNVIKVGLAFVEKLPEHHFKPFTAALYYCDLMSFLDDLSWPDHASLYEDSLFNWVPVKYLMPDTTSNLIVSLCVRPMYGFFSSISLTEFFAYYSTMGIEHFIFYNQNMSASSYAFLKFIESSSLSIEVLPWNFPLSNDLIHEYGQIVFTQDCIMRSKYKFSHTIIVDLDEFIVPKLHSSITDLVWYLDNEYKNAGGYSIPMVLFCDEFSLNSKYSSLFHAFTSNRRQKTYWTHGIRSKYIAKPNRVQHGGVHFVWKYDENWYEVKVSDSVALLHHYRHCCGLQQSWFFNLFTSNVLSDDVVTDNSIVNLLEQIINHNLVVFILNVTNSIAYAINYC